MATTANEVRDQMEEYIDGHSDHATGVANCLSELAEVCLAKAHHLRANWQDDFSGAQWDALAKVVMAAEVKASRL